MSAETVKEYLKQWNLQDRVREFDVSSATVELAALALGCEGARIAKSLSLSIGERTIIVVTAGDRKIDNAKYKAFFHAKAVMPGREEVAARTGHEVGGVCPFALPEGVDVYLDESLKRFETIYPAAGSANSAVEMTPEELEKASGCKEWIDVCRER